MKRLKYWLMIILLSVRWMFKINIGDKIIYQGKEYVVFNGVVPCSWRLLGLKNDNDSWVRRIKCRKVKTLSNAIGSFKSGYHFYMGCWYNIWVNVGIKQWMRNCNIWGK